MTTHTDSSAISPKVKATAAAGAVVTAAVLVAGLFGVNLEVSETEVTGLAALLTIATTVAAYLKRDPLRD